MSDLYIQDSSLHLSLSESKLQVRDSERALIKELSLNKIENVLVFGTAQITTQLLRHLAMKGINVFYFTSYGKFLSCLESYREADFEKQVCQAKASFDQNLCLEMSRKLIRAKVQNQINLLKQHDEDSLLSTDDYNRFFENVTGIENASSISEIIGFEGRNAKSYFYYLSLLVPHEFRFNGRSKRPAEDCFNSLLNFGYSILYSLMIGMIRKHGFNQGFALLHQPHRHHATLASDLMEEWRPIVIDDIVLSLILSGNIQQDHFEKQAEMGLVLTSEGRELFLKAIRLRMLEIHQYIELDKKRYSFLYMVDQQLSSLHHVFVEKNAELYIESYTGD